MKILIDIHTYMYIHIKYIWCRHTYKHTWICTHKSIKTSLFSHKLSWGLCMLVSANSIQSECSHRSPNKLVLELNFLSYCNIWKAQLAFFTVLYMTQHNNYFFIWSIKTGMNSSRESSRIFPLKQILEGRPVTGSHLTGVEVSWFSVLHPWLYFPVFPSDLKGSKQINTYLYAA